MNTHDIIGVFLDRDGTINEEVDFLSSSDELHLIEGSAKAIREANQLGLKVFVITNQSGIARGFLTEQQLIKIHDHLIKMLNDLGAHIDAIYYCPHHPELGEAPYRILCDCRKPNTGMLQKAVKQFGINLTKSFVIGDRMIDVQTAQAAGAASILVLTGYGKTELELCRSNNFHIDFVARNLEEAMKFVKRSVMRLETEPR